MLPIPLAVTVDGLVKRYNAARSPLQRMSRNAILVHVLVASVPTLEQEISGMEARRAKAG